MTKKRWQWEAVVTVIVSLIIVVYSYGKLTEKVDNLEKLYEKKMDDLIAEMKAQREAIQNNTLELREHRFELKKFNKD